MIALRFHKIITLRYHKTNADLNNLSIKTIPCFALYPRGIKKGSVGHRPTEASDHSPFSYDFFR